MCELHFKPEDLRWETSHFDEATGTKLNAKLQKPQLRDGAVPSLLPGCPSYLSTTTTNYRESPDAKRKRLEESALQAALAQSVADNVQYWEDRKFNSIDEILEKFDSLDTNYWSVIKKEQSLLICRIAHVPQPKIMHSILIHANCKVHAFAKDFEVKKIGDYTVPSSVDDVNTLEQLLAKLRTFDTEEHTHTPSAITIIQTVLSLLSLVKDQKFKHLHVLKFVCEQLYIMTLTKFVFHLSS